VPRVSRLARTLTPLIFVQSSPKSAPLLSLFWHPSPAPTRFVSSWWIRETGDLKSTGAPSSMATRWRRQPIPSALPPRLLVLLFQLLFPLPRATFDTVMARGKVTAEELLPRAESNGYKKGAYREKAAFGTIKATWTRPRRIKIQRWTAMSCTRPVSLKPGARSMLTRPYTGGSSQKCKKKNGKLGNGFAHVIKRFCG
jgi:hypothetical protein